MNKTLLVMSISGILLIAIVASTTAQAVPQGKPFQELDDKIVDSQGVPIGTVLDWWCLVDCTVPEGFVIADGSIVNDPESPFDGQTLPDLHDKFVRGVENIADIGVIGGTQLHSHGAASNSDLHSHLALIQGGGSHEHTTTKTSSIFGHRHGFNSEHIFVENTPSKVVSVKEDRDGRDSVLVAAINHKHDILMADHEGSTDNEPGHAHGVFEGTDHVHGGSIDNYQHSHTINVDSENNIPEYVGLLKIIRIK